MAVERAQEALDSLGFGDGDLDLRKIDRATAIILFSGALNHFGIEKPESREVAERIFDPPKRNLEVVKPLGGSEMFHDPHGISGSHFFKK